MGSLSLLPRGTAATVENNATIVTAVIALAGITIQALVGYFNHRTLVATYGVRLKTAEDDIVEIKGSVAAKAEKTDVDRLRAGEVKQWEKLDRHGEQISYLNAKVNNGKAAGA